MILQKHVRGALLEKEALSRLTESENTLFQELENHKFGQQLRLEQEQIGFEWIERKLRKV